MIQFLVISSVLAVYSILDSSNIKAKYPRIEKCISFIDNKFLVFSSFVTAINLRNPDDYPKMFKIYKYAFGVCLALAVIFFGFNHQFIVFAGCFMLIMTGFSNKQQVNSTFNKLLRMVSLLVVLFVVLVFLHNKLVFDNLYNIVFVCLFFLSVFIFAKYFVSFLTTLAAIVVTFVIKQILKVLALLEQKKRIVALGTVISFVSVLMDIVTI